MEATHLLLPPISSATLMASALSMPSPGFSDKPSVFNLACHIFKETWKKREFLLIFWEGIRHHVTCLRFIHMRWRKGMQVSLCLNHCRFGLIFPSLLYCIGGSNPLLQVCNIWGEGISVPQNMHLELMQGQCFNLCPVHKILCWQLLYPFANALQLGLMAFPRATAAPVSWRWPHAMLYCCWEEPSGWPLSQGSSTQLSQRVSQSHSLDLTPDLHLTRVWISLLAFAGYAGSCKFWKLEASLMWTDVWRSSGLVKGRQRLVLLLTSISDSFVHSRLFLCWTRWPIIQAWILLVREGMIWCLHLFCDPSAGG